jgi:hypothetical protein
MDRAQRLAQSAMDSIGEEEGGIPAPFNVREEANDA